LSVVACWARVLVLLAAAAWSSPAATQDPPVWRGYATLASSYSFRGVLLRDAPAWRLGAERQSRGWTIGAWAAGVDRAWPYERADAGWLAGAYAARDGGCGEHCRWRATVSRYVYPGSEPGGWSEASFSARWSERFGLQSAYARHDAPARGTSRTLELFVTQPLPQHVDATLTLGSSDYERFGYRYTELDLVRAWPRWSVLLGARHGQIRPPQARVRSDTRLVTELSVVF